jgi:lipoyl(octanoyl) transferase
MEIGIWSVAALPSKRMGLYKAEKSKRLERTGELVEWSLWIDDTSRPGWANMAIDEALLDRAEQVGESWIRLYTWRPHCLSFGRHEPAARRYDVNRVAALGIDTVRRPTGGRAVWHSQELTYAVAAPCRLFGSLQDGYLEIHAMLADALSHLAVPASLAPSSRLLPLEAGPCFTQAVGGEVMAGSRKVVGSAQLRRGGAFLQHGSMLLQDEQQIIAALSPGNPLKLDPPRSLLPEQLSAADLIAAITAVVQERWAGTWHEISSSDHVLQAASQHYPRFRSPAWTWKR